jgi:hypothetical protein
MESPADEIERLARLRDSGDITDAEYELLKSQIVEPSDPPVPEVPEAVPQAPTRPADELYESFIEYSPYGRSVGGANLEIGYAPTDLTRAVIPWNRSRPWVGGGGGNGMPASIYAHPHHVEILVRACGRGDIKVLVLPPHLAGLAQLREVQPSLAETVQNRIDDPQEGPRYWAGTPISIERRPRYLRVRLGNLGPDDLVCIGHQPALYSDAKFQNSRMKDNKTQLKGPSLTTVKETLEQVLLAPKDLSTPNYVSQLFESEGKLPTAPAVPTVDERREAERKEAQRKEGERRETEVTQKVSQALKEQKRELRKFERQVDARLKAEQEEAAAEREVAAAEREAASAELRERAEAVLRERKEREEASTHARKERERQIRQIEEWERDAPRQRERQEERERQQEERQRRQEEAAGRQAAREEHEAQRLEEADERNELFQAAQTALVREVLSCAVEAAFVDQSQQGCEPHKEQLLAEVQRDFGPDSTWEEVYVCIENCDWSDPDNSYWFAVEEHADAFLEEVGTRFGSTGVWGSTDLDLLASGYGGHSGDPVSIEQIAKAIASHMPLADLADIARSESEQDTTE